MEKFQISFESNTTKANEVISSLGSTLKIEKAKLQEVRIGLKTDHAEFNSSISSKITKLHDDLAMESKILDALVVKTAKVKVLTVKLENAEKRVNDLLSEKAAMKSCIADVNGLLSDIIKARDSMIIITVKKCLSENLRPVYAIIHRLEGVPESSSIPKQRGEGVTQSKKEDPKPSAKPTVKSENEPKGKEKIFSEEPIIDNSEDEELDENELKRRKDRIQNEAVDIPIQYWLELVVSFDLQNTQDSQLDLKAFRFRSFVKVENVPSTDSGAYHLLFLFYLKHVKPQYKTWSASKIIVVKATDQIEIDSFPNAKFKVMRGSSSQVHKFTLIDLPCLNPYD
ncbi:unnamed protein product [Lactuca saligna]|uniref:Uncharacterized protein n=1 Tax=Lactuca saligna TaxID=75948 RepID=A0AA36EBI1_LACSI|nr:unnamed protein product [Lactuca saligna]